MTLYEKYYAINEKLNQFLQGKYSDLKILKYGIDPATLKVDANKVEKVYPYAISYITNIKEKAWTSLETGTFTEFDLQISFFTSPQTEFTNDSVIQKAFDLLRVGITDINLKVLENICNLKRLKDVPSFFNIVSGAVVPSRILIAEMQAICSYPESIGQPTLATDTESALSFEIKEEV